MGQFGGPMGGPPPDPWGPAKSKAMNRGGQKTLGLDAAAPQGGSPGSGKPDAETGYVEAPGGPKCGNCNQLDKASGMCPVVGKQVSADNGNCDSWDDGSGQPGIDVAGAQGTGPAAESMPTQKPLGI